MLLPIRKKAIGCHWVFVVKFNLDGFVLGPKQLQFEKMILIIAEMIITIKKINK